jgi:hypothetical protein
VRNLRDSIFMDKRFDEILSESPPFSLEMIDEFQGYILRTIGHGDGRKLMDKVSQGRFHPNKKLIQTVFRTIEGDDRWNLIDEQLVAYNAIMAEVKKCVARYKGKDEKDSRSVVMLTGGPGTGKSVIAIQLLADALRSKYTTAHSTGSKAFTTTLKGLFKGASRLFIWNMHTRNAAPMGLDLLIVDEAHRIRETSDTRFTPAAERNRKSQIQELIEASKVTVMLLDENQFVRPDEIGTPELIRTYCRDNGIVLKEFDLPTQFRCSGSTGYINWVDNILGYERKEIYDFRNEYMFKLVNSVEELEEEVYDHHKKGSSARLIAGFCWPWSDPLPDSSLVNDVEIDGWSKPWNRKRGKGYYRPEEDPYTIWATQDQGVHEVGCIYSSQGFEFDHVGVIMGPDIVRRGDEWVFQKDSSFDRPVKAKNADSVNLVKNAYRVLMTRGMLSCSLYVIDDETRDFIEDEYKRILKV